MRGPPKTLAERANQGIVIREPGSEEAAVDDDAEPMQLDSAAGADEEYARRLQGKLDAQEYAAAQRGGGRGRKPDKGVYIKISEEEIADDYPMPKQYVKEVEEVDELLVNGDECMLLDIDPDNLPTQVLL